jgi:hypothetical protein
MKPDQTKIKLQLKKQFVSNLTNPEVNKIRGGAEEAWTTSRRVCTGFLCCEPQTDNCPTNLTCTTICSAFCPITIL